MGGWVIIHRPKIYTPAATQLHTVLFLPVRRPTLFVEVVVVPTNRSQPHRDGTTGQIPTAEPANKTNEDASE